MSAWQSASQHHPSYERYATESDPAVTGATVASRIRYALRHATRGAAFYGSRRSVDGHFGANTVDRRARCPCAPTVAYLGCDSHKFFRHLLATRGPNPRHASLANSACLGFSRGINLATSHQAGAWRSACRVTPRPRLPLALRVAAKAILARHLVGNTSHIASEARFAITGEYALAQHQIVWIASPA